jgi:predicted kinase
LLLTTKYSYKFKAYRAYVRGKVTSFRLDDESLSDDERQEAQETAQAYFRLARSYTRKAFSRPLLVLTCGLMGTGKTYIGQELARRWDMAYLSSDETRKRLAGIAATEHRYESYGRGIYSPEFTRRTYDTMCDEARHKLSSGKSMLLDATFHSASERRQAVEAADAAGADAYIVECIASEDEIRRRLERRTQGREATASDGRWELFQRQKADWEPVNEVPQRCHIRLDTTGPREDNIRALLRLLFERALTSSHSPPSR